MRWSISFFWCKYVSFLRLFTKIKFSSVTQLCPSLWDPMDCSTPRLPCPSPTPRACTNSCPLCRWCHPTISPSVIPSPPAFSVFQHQGLFQRAGLFTSDGQSIGASASASVLPMNIQHWFSLGWTDLISLQSRRFSRVSSNTTVQKHQFLGTQLSL